MDCYFGYPITPQNEVTSYLSRRMLEEDRVFLQCESELAAINMIFGAFWSFGGFLAKKVIFRVKVVTFTQESIFYSLWATLRSHMSNRPPPRYTKVYIGVKYGSWTIV